MRRGAVEAIIKQVIRENLIENMFQQRPKGDEEVCHGDI